MDGLSPKIVCFSGWHQPHDALRDFAGSGSYHVAYSHHPDMQTIAERLEDEAKEADIVIAWSLGGQVACHLAAEKIIAPKLLVLLAVPYQYVSGDGRQAMPTHIYEAFQQNLHQDPKRTVARFHPLIAMNDREHKAITRALQAQEAVDSEEWKHWLEHLGEFSCDALDFSDFPPTLVVHGEGDQVVRHHQAAWFGEALPQVRHLTLPECGHAPHLHAPERVWSAITEYYQDITR